MADPVVADPPKQPDPTPGAVNFSADFDSLPIPPLDHEFFSSDDAVPPENFFSDLGLGFEENCDYELTFDDIDDLYLPSETEEFLIPDGFDNSLCPNGLNSDRGVNPMPGDAVAVKSASLESGSSTVSGVRDYDVSGFLNCHSSESGGCDSEYSRNSVDRKSKMAGAMDSPSPDCDQEVFSVEQASSQGSGNCGSGVLEGANSPAHSGSSDKDVSSNVFVDQKVKVEGNGKNYVSKRKKEPEEGNVESRTPKFRRSSAPAENVHSQSSLNPLGEEDDKRKARLMRNRESAQLSRQRKKHYVEELEDKVRNMNSTISDLNSRISYIMAENATLRQQLSGGRMCPPPPPPPPPGMYPHSPMGPMSYPWVPCAPYVVKPQGSQVPLIPIPRLKPQQTVSASKAKKLVGKKTEGGKTKKVASISILGFVFLFVLFGMLFPMVNLNSGGFTNKVPGGSVYSVGGPYDQHQGKVLRVDHFLNRSGRELEVGSFNRVHHERGRDRGEKLDCGEKEIGCQAFPGSGDFVPLGNGSEPLVASLYVPRNDKLVQIDGNLIIHSVLASEKTKASLAHSEMKSKRETSLAIARDISPAYVVPEAGENRGRRAPLYRNPSERQRALSSGAADTTKNDRLKSSSADGKLQQWFREGLAGPMLSSGMCTEVFQFDVSPASTSGAIVPASSVSNISAKQRQNTTQNATRTKGVNRRILRRLPVPLSGSNFNITEEHTSRNSPKDEFQGNRSVSSMVVSVLVDPREAGDSDVDGVMKPKSLSRIFVVVLIDSVRYVTYSCVLPRSAPHLVTA